MALTLGALLLPAAAEATQPETAISYLNQQRASYGIPPVTLDQSLLKSECNLGNHEIASPLTSWSSTSSPWDKAPYHEWILYDPADVRAGYGEYDGFGSEGGTWACMWFAHDWGGTPSFYWAAEASGPGAVPPALSAYEAPSTPAEDAGLSNPTGPNLEVYAQNLPGQPAPMAASVVSAGGTAVPVHLVPFANGGVVVVDHPLAPASTYRATVQWRSEYVEAEGEEPGEFTQRFEFTTATGAAQELTPLLKLRRRARFSRLVWIESDELLRNRNVGLAVRVLQKGCRFCAWRRVRTIHRSLALTAKRVGVRLPPRRPRRLFIVSVRSRPFEAGGNRVSGAYSQLTVR